MRVPTYSRQWDDTNTERSRTFKTSGVIGSAVMSLRIRMSRIRKFVAQVSSSKSRVSAPSSSASVTKGMSVSFTIIVIMRNLTSVTPAAIDVLPLASCVEKDVVGIPPGRLLMNGEMSTFVTALPSSPSMDTVLELVTTNSRPSQTGRLS